MATEEAVRATLVVLEKLAAPVKKKAALLTRTRATMVLSHGLASLPDDVLIAIFEMIIRTDTSTRYKADGYPGRLIRLALVCRRFRGVVLSRPSLWTFLSPDVMLRYPGAVQQFLLGSQQCDLSLVVYPRCIASNDPHGSPKELNGAKMVNLIAAHQHRWAVLDVDLMHRSWQAYKAKKADELLSKSITSLPRLQKLSYEGSAEVDHVLDVLGRAAVNATHYNLQLRSDHIPFLPAALTELNFYNKLLPSNMEDFISMLSNMPSLEYLTLHWPEDESNAEQSARLKDSPPPAPRAFRSLKNLILMIDNNVAAYILPSLSFPQVAIMELSVFPSWDDPIYLPDLSLSFPSSSYPSLEHFAFLPPEMDLRNVTLPPVRKLTVALQKRHLKQLDWLESYGAELRAKGASEQFTICQIRVDHQYLSGTVKRELRKVKDAFMGKLQVF